MAPEKPVASEPTEDWEHWSLYRRVRSALLSLPTRFASSLVIDGVLATDLFAFNSSLGATIEEQVVAALNKLRPVWDPDSEYALYDFERQPQTFPDVVLKSNSPDADPSILLGIELKGWYALAKENVPSFRYKATPSVCAPADLLVVVPWALSNVVSGTPIVFKPYLVPAKFAAEYRNWHWEFGRSTKEDSRVEIASADSWYPTKSDLISDTPVYDKGGNFGRFARTGLMDDFVEELRAERLSGIPIHAWQRFLGIFSEGSKGDDIDAAVSRLSDGLSSVAIHQNAEQISEKLHELAALLQAHGERG